MGGRRGEGSARTIYICIEHLRSSDETVKHHNHYFGPNEMRGDVRIDFVDKASRSFKENAKRG